jgi:hypothetical protein
MIVELRKSFISSWLFLTMTSRNDLVKDYFAALNENRNIESWVVHTPYDPLSEEVFDEDCAVNDCIDVINEGINDPLIVSVMQRFADMFGGMDFYEMRDFTDDIHTTGYDIKEHMHNKYGYLVDDEKAILENRIMQSILSREPIMLDEEEFEDALSETCKAYNQLFDKGMESIVWGNLFC